MASITPNTILKQFEKEEIEAQALVWKHMFGFADTIMLRTIVKLGIPDIVHNHGPITLSQLATQLPIVSLSIDRLNIFMRYALHMNLFKISTDEITKESKYELTPASKLLVKSHNKSLAPYVMLQTHPQEFAIWGHAVDCLEGKIWDDVSNTPGTSLYEAIEKDPEIFSDLFTDALASNSRLMLPALVSGLVKEKVLDGVGSIVDVGGNSGVTAKAILDAFPHIMCSVMDLNHVIDSVIKDPKLDFVAGDMFTSVPKADAILLKSTLHNHGDDECLKILSNAKQAIPSAGGRVILVDIVVDIEGLPEFSLARLSMEMEMMFIGGKERTKQDWETLLSKAGFSHHKIIPIVAIESIIVAYA